jgi:hypothetical protein
VASRSAKRNCQQLEDIAIQLFQQATEQRVQFEASKTELIHFSRKKQPYTNPVTLPGGIIVQPNPLVRWLGIWFDPRLTFKPHIEKRLNLALGAWHKAQRLQKGLGFRALRQLYTAYITTIADFGAPLWWQAARTTTTIISKFQKLQNLVTTAMLGAYKGSPYKALELEAAI